MNNSKPTPPITKMDEKKGAAPIGCKPEAYSNTHDGNVVSIHGNKLVTTCHEGKEHSYTVAADAKVTCDGTACKAEDLKAGEKVRLTTKPNDKHTCTKVEALKKHVEFAKV
ncbi:hypothetical protein [Schlesneria paludicola]|uniref:hypothetical protein n=1 Tax=Schlesneria paludicola TaxID=360056 RepID=UPI00029AA6F3|nr:hypothetical protein [Schlesneria paludicola]